MRNVPLSSKFLRLTLVSVEVKKRHFSVFPCNCKKIAKFLMLASSAKFCTSTIQKVCKVGIRSKRRIFAPLKFCRKIVKFLTLA